MKTQYQSLLVYSSKAKAGSVQIRALATVVVMQSVDCLLHREITFQEYGTILVQSNVPNLEYKSHDLHKQLKCYEN